MFRIMAPKDSHVLIPRIRKCITLHDKSIFAVVINIKDLQMGEIFPGSLGNYTPLKLEEEGRRLGQRDEMEEEALEIQVQERLPIVGWI